MERYRTVLVDWHGTLCRSLFWEHWREEHPEAHARVTQGLERLQAEGLLDEWMRGRLTAEEAVARLAAISAVDEALLFQGLRESCQRMHVDERLQAALRALRAAGVAVVLATDNMDTLARFTLPALGLADCFDLVLDSSRLGALKDDRHGAARPFYAAFLTGPLVGPVLLIDDRPEAASVSELGFDFRLVASPEETLVVLEELLAAA